VAPVILALGALLSIPAGAAPPPESSLVTRWSRDVTPDRVLPEYPRPQLTRRAWQNLNGGWDYAIVAREAPRPRQFDGRILVPFPVQSALSGVRRPVGEAERLWYRRMFQAPALADGHRLLLHFGAVDWEAEVFVNGAKVGEHRGGYDPFTFDITDALGDNREQELVVAVWDPTDRGPQPRGKQVMRPRGIWYTAVTGIWQTVWLEPVPRAYVSGLTITPASDLRTATVDVAVTGGRATDVVRVTALDGDRTVATAEGRAGQPVTLAIPDAHRWSPADPFLYGLRVSITGGDDVESYFGMRSIAVAKDAAGINRLFLNGAPLFEFGLLDQGWWPDGLYTAPTDEALAFDIETTKRLGYNLIRKHVKVEPARWYYHADRLGVLVWQDMPSGNNDTPAGRENFARELEHVIDALRNHPSIVMWVPFNEGWGQHDAARYTDWLKRRDPSRLVNHASGWTDEGVSDVSDAHAYPGPVRPMLEDGRAAVLGEFGGLGLPLEGHTWIDAGNWGYRSYTTRESLADAYRARLDQLRLLEAEGLAAAIYTQTTDVEVEVNGVMTYDRAVVKLPDDAAAVNERMYGPPPEIRTLVPCSDQTPQTWRYTTTRPTGEWSNPQYDDSAWKTGPGGFGRPGTPRGPVGTVWDTPTIWLRRTFTLGAWTYENPMLRIYHDEEVDVEINGVVVATLQGYTQGYTYVPLGVMGDATLIPGENTLALYVSQTRGGQFIDACLVDVIER